MALLLGPELLAREIELRALVLVIQEDLDQLYFRLVNRRLISLPRAARLIQHRVRDFASHAAEPALLRVPPERIVHLPLAAAGDIWLKSIDAAAAREATAQEKSS